MFPHTDFFKLAMQKGNDLFLPESIQKIVVKFSKRLSICTVMSLRDISEKTWVHSYPMMPQATLCLSEDQTLAQCHVCLPSWPAMHDVCDMRKKCAVAMGANVLKEQAL